MRNRSWAAVTALTFGAVTLVWALGGPPAPKAPAADKVKPAPAKADKEKAGKDVFGLAQVWHFDLRLSAAEWDRMQPTGGMRFPGGPGGPGGRPGFGGPGGP